MLLNNPEAVNITARNIAYMKVITYIRAGYVLHGFSIVVFSLFFICFSHFRISTGWFKLLYGILSIFLFSITITSQLDARSRYQNYKLCKDLLYQYGCRVVVMKPFSRSRCQRDALTEAASQLGLQLQMKQYFDSLGYRWYHIIPTVLIENPLILFTRSYWLTTFFVHTYKSKYFYW
jgi:hypothetical protein